MRTMLSELMTVTLGDIGSIAAAAIALLALFHSIFTGRRAGDANLRAINAELRAEEALQVAKNVAQIENSRHLRETSRLEGEKLAALWIQEIRQKQRPGLMIKGDVFRLQKPASTDAELEAFKILQSKQTELSLTNVSLNQTRGTVHVMGFTYPDQDEPKT
jgi:hypothetical protein